MNIDLQRSLISRIKKIPGDGSDKTKFHYFCGHALRMCGVDMSQVGWLVGFGGEMTSFKLAFQNSPNEFQKALDAYIKLVQKSDPFEDVLLHVHEELVHNRDSRGKCQHFTPPQLAAGVMRLMPRSDQGLVNDPTCGSGILLLESCKTAKPADLMGHHVRGNDLDHLCAAMTALQLMANQLLHHRPIGCLTVECKDIISEYTLFKPIVTCMRQEYSSAMQCVFQSQFG